jgi:crotonobetainyl-CoA:carnitine CoA-transferase CaiB-like acyl-CoA transferase
MAPSTRGVLAGVRVVEFATLVAGPAAGSHLAQLGADVIKVEPPGGDPSRLLTAPGHPDLVAPPYLANNVGKRSMIIDLKDKRGAATACELLATADVVIENYRPGAFARLGLDPAGVLAANPRLHWFSLRGYGPDGSWRDRPAVDGIVQADSGMIEITGHDGGPGVRVGFPVVDHAAGWVLVAAVLAALLGRADGTGRPDQAGRHHQVVLFDVALSMQASPFTDYLVSGTLPRRIGNASQLSAPNETLRSSDGSVMMAAYLAGHWRTLCELLDCTELLTDPRFVEREDRMRNRPALIDELERRTMRYTAEELFELLDGAGLMAGVSRSYAQVADCPQVIENGLLMDVCADDGKHYRGLRSPLAEFGTSAAGFVVGAGAQTEEIQRELSARGATEAVSASGAREDHADRLHG